MSQTVITQGQWRVVMGTEPWLDPAVDKGHWDWPGQCGDDFPAHFVTWDDANRFCDTLTVLEQETGRLSASQSYRLPTEAEWEYACRAGTKTAYSFGNDVMQLDDYGWYIKNSGSQLHPVAKKKLNPWALYDMHGNVWEWCSDWYSKQLPGGEDPVGPARGSYRVIRGGSWSYASSQCRSASRAIGGVQDRLGYHFGFRVVCTE
jgi:formylglycine-generating enzyme required for sulfatase activity